MGNGLIRQALQECLLSLSVPLFSCCRQIVWLIRLLFVILRLKKEDCYNPYGEATLYDTANIG